MGTFNVSLKTLTDRVSMEVVYTPRALDEISVEIAEVNRPGLFLAGYYDYFDKLRLQIMGLAEMNFLSGLTAEKRYEALEQLFRQQPPAVIVCRSEELTPFPEMQELAQKHGVAGLLNIFCMTGWFGIYISKKRQDMLWPDMTWVFIIAYDLWNFCYTYNCLPTHSWYCGIALLLAPTIAGLLWNKGGWIQNRAFTLSMWCMFCQMVPMFVNDSAFAVQSVNNPAVNTVVSVIALVANILALGYIIYRAKKLKVNPYKQEVFVGTKDFSKAMSRRADTAYLLETEPKSATPAEIAEMVAYNELPVDGEIGFVYVAKDKNEIDVDVETIKRE